MKKEAILVFVVSFIVFAGVIVILYNLGISKPPADIGEAAPKETLAEGTPGEMETANPAEADATYEWIVAPTLDYEWIGYDLQCDSFLSSGGEYKVDSNTGEISDEHYGHGSGGGIVVYDHQQKKWGSQSYDSVWVAILPTIEEARDYTCDNYSAYSKITDIFPVLNISVLKNGSLSTEGNVENLVLDSTHGGPFEGLYKVNGKYAYATNDGLFTEFIYEDIDGYVNTSKPAVKQGDKWGFIDKTGAWIIPCEFDAAVSIDDERAFVKQNGKWGIIRKEKESEN